MMSILMVSVFSFGFVSCGSDDDEEKINSSILGTWEDTDQYDGVWQWTFNSNGHGNGHVVNRVVEYTFYYDFSFDGEKLVITGMEDGKTYTDHYKVTFSSDGKKMTWVDYDKGYKTEFVKK